MVRQVEYDRKDIRSFLYKIHFIIVMSHDDKSTSIWCDQKKRRKKKTKKSFLISKRLRRRKYCLRSVIIPNYYSTKVIKCSAQFSCWDIIVLEICDNVAVQILLKNEKKLFDQNICYIPESAPSDSSKGLKSIEM